MFSHSSRSQLVFQCSLQFLCSGYWRYNIILTLVKQQTQLLPQPLFVLLLFLILLLILLFVHKHNFLRQLFSFRPQLPSNRLSVGTHRQPPKLDFPSSCLHIHTHTCNKAERSKHTRLANIKWLEFFCGWRRSTTRYSPCSEKSVRNISCVNRATIYKSKATLPRQGRTHIFLSYFSEKKHRKRDKEVEKTQKRRKCNVW